LSSLVGTEIDIPGRYRLRDALSEQDNEKLLAEFEKKNTVAA
jgi:hypothetical protein